ncbi:MAG TPA: hypothetical protein VE974_02380 [Thermoanaerobaculia bacterium]|nr:hypothetical protein [Thermoanaerobaculia bacterium]
MNLEDFTPDTVRPHVGTNFHATLDESRVVELLLEEVKVVHEKHVSPRMNRDSFSLYFVGPDNVYMPQSMYNLSHDDLGGPWPVFLVPVGQRGATFLYEAAFT